MRVRVNQTASAPYAAWTPTAAPLPVGSVLAAFHEEAGAPRAIYVMTKAEAGWTYQVLSASGVPQPESEALCARCHAEAASDFVFGVRDGK